jgi:signal transduction histidine kinase
MFWSMLANAGAYMAISLMSRQSPIERVQATLFVDVFRFTDQSGRSGLWRGSATMGDLSELLARFLGPERAGQALSNYAYANGLNIGRIKEAEPALVSYAERLLAGSIGSASARVTMSSIVKGEVVGIDEVLQILDETSEVIEYSHQLEEKSRELERASAELREANARMQELDRLKDDFLSKISHELRTPLTSIRSFGEILYDDGSLDEARRREFLGIVIKESDRLTRLINQILDLAKMEAGRVEWRMEDFEVEDAILEAVAVSGGLAPGADLKLEVNVPTDLPAVRADRDRFIQVLVNLLANARKFCDEVAPFIAVTAVRSDGELLVRIEDNGPGVAPGAEEVIFDRFQQAGDWLADKPQGTGLGLSICREIVDYTGGRIWVERRAGGGAIFAFTVPFAQSRIAAE